MLDLIVYGYIFKFGEEMIYLISFIRTVVSVLTFLVFINALLSYFLDPYHPIRKAIGMVVDPLLDPIRKLVSPIGGIDLSPMILIFILQIVGSVLVTLLRRFI